MVAQNKKIALTDEKPQIKKKKEKRKSILTESTQEFLSINGLQKRLEV